MEGTQTLLLLEEILTGRIQNSMIFQKKVSKLHKLLEKSSKSVIRAAIVVSSRLKFNKKLSEEDFLIVKNYLNDFIAGKNPSKLSLFQFGFENFYAQQSGKIIFAMNMLSKKLLNLKFSTFYQIQNYSKNKDNNARNLMNLVKFLNKTEKKSRLNLIKTFGKWKQKSITNNFSNFDRGRLSKLNKLEVIKEIIMQRDILLQEKIKEIKDKYLVKIINGFVKLFDKFQSKWNHWKKFNLNHSVILFLKNYKKNNLCRFIRKKYKKVLQNTFIQIFNVKDIKICNYQSILKRLIINSIKPFFNLIFSPKRTRLFLILQKIEFRTIRNFVSKITFVDYKIALATIMKFYKKPFEFSFSMLKNVLKAFRFEFKISRFLSVISKFDLRIKQKKLQYFSNFKSNFTKSQKMILSKYIKKLILYSSISYQTAFFKWKFFHHTISSVDSHNPGLVLCKKLDLLVGSYQNRLKQFVMFKLIIFSPIFLPRNTISTIHSSENSQSFNHDQLLCNQISKELENSSSMNEKLYTKSYEKGLSDSLNLSNLSTNISAKISKDDYLNVTQSGAIEILFFVVKSVKLRRFEWAMAHLNAFSNNLHENWQEKENLLYEINELQYDKQELLEDNTTLRMHNEGLIDHLEKTNENFYQMNLMLNQMKVVRMVNVLSKIVELPLLEVILILRFNKNYWKI